VSGSPEAERVASGRSSGRPEVSKGAVVSGGAVTFSSAGSLRPERNGRPRLVLLAAAVVVVGIALGFTFASLRDPDRVISPPALPGSAENGPERPTSFVLLIDSEPPGALVREGSQKLGTTPARISVENEDTRHSPRKVSVEREGFLPYSIVQGPSDHDVHVIAVLEPIAGVPPPSPAVPQAHRLDPPAVPFARSSAEPSRVLPPPPAHPSPPDDDIRLQR
jgi:hypothetical protein